MRQAAGTRGRKTQWWYVGAVWLTVPLLLFFLLEIVIGFVYTPRSSPLLVQFVTYEWRDQQVYQLDPDLFWTFHPNMVLRGTNEKGRYGSAVNNIGFRGPNFPEPGAVDALRIMVLGDSCAFGVFTDMGDAFPEQLQTMLEAAHPELPVVLFNGGVPGYSSQQTAIQLEKYGTLFNPHLVLIYVGAGDVVPRVNLSDREILERHRGELRRGQLFENSRTFLFFRDHFSPLPKVDLEKILVEHEYVGPYRVELPESRVNFERMIRTTRDVLGATPVLLTRQNIIETHPTNQINELIRVLAAEHNIPLVEVAEHFRQWENPVELYAKPPKDIVHPNILGYREIARLTFQVLEKSPQTRPLLEPGPPPAP